MKSVKLLEILNEVKQPDELLIRLDEANFAVTEFTEEGDSILHVLARANLAKNSGFSEYLTVLMAAGADPNAVDKQGNGFLNDFLKNARLCDVHRIFDLLLDSNEFNINQTPENGQSLFEFLYNLTEYHQRELFRKLIEHKKFDPNQKTSKHNSVLLHMISEPVYQHRQQMYGMAAHAKTNPNIKNKNGQTALALLLSDIQYKNMSLISPLIDHEQCDINALDQEGNNYLQLVSIHCRYQSEEIATLLINKGIDVTHKNNEGKTVFDLISENKAGRSDYANKKLFLDMLKLHPSSLFEKNSSGLMILRELFRSQDYTITSEFSTLLELCKKQKNSTELLKNIISDCFDDFRNKRISEASIISLSKAIIEADITIDLEYCLAHIVIHPSFYQKEELYNSLTKLAPEVNLNTIISHVKRLTKENSEDRAEGLHFVTELGLQLDCFDGEILALETDYLRNKSKSGIDRDSKMLGHLFSLSGSIPVNNHPLKLTGGFSSDTAPFLMHLMNAYVSHCETSGAHSEHLEGIRQVRNMTVKAVRFYFLSKSWPNYYPSMKNSRDRVVSSMIEDSKNTGVELITGWTGHAVNLIVKQDNLYRNNGGGCSTDATTEHYKISKPENLTPAVIEELYGKSHQESNKTYIQRDLHAILGLIFEGMIAGTFQTVGNCSLESLIIALKIKYRLFFPEHIADELFTDTVRFFEQFYLAEYLSQYSNNSTLPHLLMRLIIQKLIPEGQLELAGTLLKDHFISQANQEIMQVEFMIHRWKLRFNSGSTGRFDTQLHTLGVELKPDMNRRLQLLERFLNDEVTGDDLDELRSWPADQQTFQGYHLLHFAIMNNNTALVTQLIQMFPSAVNQTNWFDQEPLCLVQSVEMIDLLIKAGASTSRTEDDNALDYAIKANRVDLVSALLKNGAQPSEYSAYYAATKDPKILQSLMEYYPATITKPTHNHSSAIHAAARSGHNENLRTLVYYGGANPAASDVNGVTPIQLALKNGHNDTARLLLQYPGTLFKSPHRGDSVVKMAKDDDLQRTIKLKKKEKKADLKHFETFKNSNPGVVEEDIDYLLLAIHFKDVRAIRGCLLAYPDIKVVNNSKLYCTTPLAAAIQNLAQLKGKDYDEAFEIVQLLMKTPGIDINACMASSEPILFMATSINDAAVLDLFLADPKLDPNQRDNVGYTALHDAVERGHLSCVKRLLQDERVDSTLVNHKNKTAADLKSFDEGVKECCEEVARHQQIKQGNTFGMAV
ncbi:ankyrin repeat domain-containing protein [Legionella bononiensis]|uniref:Ankyrin repeat domain-containing protein n=1 Tax=Legionella bononiensis TaxID=2793102 RepID=A0ABS1WC21_9GAMM|nr:ankyrin repeat domain-containing protein [Legionella bononiensis]MBL7479172.1 ankyrin repeat domain-containing protein [Legionella bononiensis]MBL7526908.1 ankyrin repeat domain-containing protein [Legionella bononiensis]MBL7563822.1 ankyrin repeat domain-containing protein [Legionella bononiensis]